MFIFSNIFDFKLESCKFRGDFFKGSFLWYYCPLILANSFGLEPLAVQLVDRNVTGKMPIEGIVEIYQSRSRCIEHRTGRSLCWKRESGRLQACRQVLYFVSSATEILLHIIIPIKHLLQPFPLSPVLHILLPNLLRIHSLYPCI